MQNLLLLVAFVSGKNVKSFFEDQNFGDDLMYVDSSATMKAEESEARRLAGNDGGDDDEDNDSAPSSAASYKADALWSLGVGATMVFLPLLQWALLKWVWTEPVDANKNFVQKALEQTWMQPLLLILSILVGGLVVNFAPEMSEDDASDEPDENDAPDARRSSYTDKFTGFLPLFLFAAIAWVVSSAYAFTSLEKLKTYKDMMLLGVVALGLVAQFVYNAM